MTKILVIEDEKGIRETIIDTLEYADYEVEAAENCVNGVELAKAFMPDLILCDVMMPELDGYGVLLELSQIPNLSRTPFIFLTAKATKEDMRRGMSLGADDYLTKPFTSQELLEAVKSRLDRYTQLQKYNTEQMDFVRQYINLTLPHELRTPLAGIMGYLYMLQDGFEDMDNETIRKMLAAIKRSSGRLSHLVENYIAYGQIQLIHNDPDLIAKILEFSTAKEFDNVVLQCAEQVAYEAGRMEDLTIEAETANVHIFFDHGKKLISEILSNAFKFSQKGTPITVCARIENDNYVISVTNQGRGMTSDQITNIKANNQFERDKFEQQGAGLGLVIAQKILEIYSGKLIIESEPDVNTTVHMVIQLA